MCTECGARATTYARHVVRPYIAQPTVFGAVGSEVKAPVIAPVGATSLSAVFSDVHVRQYQFAGPSSSYPRHFPTGPQVAGTTGCPVDSTDTVASGDDRGKSFSYVRVYTTEVWPRTGKVTAIEGQHSSYTSSYDPHLVSFRSTSTSYV